MREQSACLDQEPVLEKKCQGLKNLEDLQKLRGLAKTLEDLQKTYRTREKLDDLDKLRGLASKDRGLGKT